jgi:phosphoribosylglycinamide formyltransferase-1
VKLIKKIRIGALVSGDGTNLQAIIDSCQNGKIAGELVFVGSDNPKAYGLERARQNNLATVVVDYGAVIREFKRDPQPAVLPEDLDLADLRRKQGLFAEQVDSDKIDFFLKTRVIAEARLLNAVKPYPFDLLVLAGFMRNLTPYFIDRVNNDRRRPRIMNIHPALLPAFAGTDGYGDTFRYGCKVAGCTVHFVDYGEDTGPIIAQRAFPIQPDDTIETIRKKGLKLEWELYPECIQLFAEGRIQTLAVTYTLVSGKTMERMVVKITPSAK